jgi:apolipoprotein D and lipocalin family protein
MKTRFAGFTCVMSLALGCSTDPPLEVATVELAKFEGGYFEIAKLPRPTQADCAATTAFYRRVSESELAVVHECREGSLDGPLRRSAARALVTDPDVPAKLSLDVGGFFGDYWIVDVADDYRYAAVGHPSRDYLWILSRTPTLADSDLAALEALLREADFDVSRLEFTEQREDTPSVVPPREIPKLESHGCNYVATPLAPNGTVLVSLLALALGAVLRRNRSGTPQSQTTYGDALERPRQPSEGAAP